MIKQLFDKEICIHCDQDCSFGTGRYVNRYPYYSDEIEGYVCGECDTENQKLIERK